MTNQAAMAGAAAAIARATRASGAIIEVEPEYFSRILQRTESPLVVHAPAGLLGNKHQYLTGYKGMVFFSKSNEPLQLPGGTELIESKKIWVPA